MHFEGQELRPDASEPVPMEWEQDRVEEEGAEEVKSCPLIEQNINHVVSFSGGVGSWMAAKRVAEKHGTERLHLLFTDTKIEDEDLYRFLYEAAENVGGTLHIIEDGRDPFQVFKDVRLMGNSQKDPCSRILKRELADKWIAENFTPETVRVYLGIDWTESHRYETTAKLKKPWQYFAPLCEKPYITKNDIFRILKDEGIEIPRLYKMGFQHNNCGGFCIKAGQAQFQKLWLEMPERYAEIEKQEESVYQHIGSKHPFIRMTRNKKMRYLSLKEFRTEILEKGVQVDLFDWGGCGCFLVDEP